MKINHLSNLNIQELMIMRPRFYNPEEARPYFKITRSVSEQIKNTAIDGIEIPYLSMGMSKSYKIAIE